MKESVLDEAREIIELIVELARETGQPVAIIDDGDGIKVGVLNAQPEDEDWFWTPAPVEQLIERE